ncbi:MAG: hypothetical protein WBA10_02135 [Elainellaceae cyanobacterium]
MVRILSSLKRFAAWSRVTVTMLVAAALLLTTSCSATSASAADSSLSPESAGVGSDNPGRSQFTNTYDEVQSQKGGMNRYEDTDPRRNSSDVTAKADRLVESAKANLDKVQDTDDFVDNYKSGTPLGQRVKNIGDNIGDKAENVADDVTSANVRRDRIRNLGTQNAENILDNTAEPAKRAARDAASSAQRTGRNVTKSTQRAAKDAADAVGDTVNDAAKNIKRAAADAVDTMTR